MVFRISSLRAWGASLLLTSLGGSLSLGSSLALGSSLVLGNSLALAQPAPTPAPRPGLERTRLTPAQQQQLFPGLRSLTQQSLQARIAILQQQQRCVAAATVASALKRCQRQERTATLSERRRYWATMRQLLERNGLIRTPQPLPEQRPGQAPGAGLPI